MRRLPHASLAVPSRRSAVLLVAAVAAALLPLVVHRDAAALPSPPGFAFRPGPATVLQASGPAIAKLSRGTAFSVTGLEGLSAGKASAVLLDVNVQSASKAGRVSFAAKLGKSSGPAVVVAFAKGGAARQRIAVPLLRGAAVVATGGAGLTGLKVELAGWIGSAGDDPTRPPMAVCRVADSQSGLGVDKGRLDPRYRYAVTISDNAPAGATAVVGLLRVAGGTGKGKLNIVGGAVAMSVAVSRGSLSELAVSFPVGLAPTVTVDGATADLSVDVIGFLVGGDLVSCSAQTGSSAPALVAATGVTVVSASLTIGSGNSVVAAPPDSGSQGATTTPSATSTATTTVPSATTVATTAATTATSATTATTVATTASTAPATSPSTAATTVPASLPPGRATSDRPDDFGGAQIHVIYMGGSPKGGRIDRSLDTNGALQTSIAAAQAWLQGATGKRLRIDTYQGAPDITYVQSAYDNADLANLGIGAYYWLEQDLIDHGQEVPGKYYLVYYDGDMTMSCGSSSHPPTIGGHIAGVYLRGPNCQSLTTSASAPGYIEMVAIHEVFHMMGLVPSCAPNQISDGHVPESNDLMYLGGGVWAPSVVDVNHDDYWGHGRTNCPDGNRSALLTPQGPDLPPEGNRTLEGTQ